MLILEQTKDPQTHGQGPADPSLRQAVRLTGVQRVFDPLYKQPLLEVQWAPEDGLGFDLTVTSDNNQCAQASGNVVLVANGVATTETIAVSSPILSHSGLSYATPFPDPKTVGRHQARRLRSLYHKWREQVEAWRWQADGGTPLSAEQLEDLRLQIGIEELERLGLSGDRREGPHDALAELEADALAELLARTELEADALAELLAESKGDPLAALLARTRLEADALAELVARTNLEIDALAELLTHARLEANALSELLARADRLLAGRRRRLEFLARLAEGTGTLNDVLIEELTEDWGEELTAALAPGQRGAWGPAATAITQDPRAALPVLQLADGTGDTWAPALDLIGVAPTDQVFVAEVNDQVIAQLRINNPPPATVTLPTSADTAAGSGSTLPFIASTGVTKGVVVSGFNIADGTTVSDVTATSVVLSQPVTGDVPKGSSITFVVTLSASYWVGNGTAGNAEVEAINALVWSPAKPRLPVPPEGPSSYPHRAASPASAIRWRSPAGSMPRLPPRPSLRSPVRARSANSGRSPWTTTTRSPRPSRGFAAAPPSCDPPVLSPLSTWRFNPNAARIPPPSCSLTCGTAGAGAQGRPAGACIATALPAARGGPRHHPRIRDDPPRRRAPPRAAAVQRLAARRHSGVVQPGAAGFRHAGVRQSDHRCGPRGQRRRFGDAAPVRLPR